MSINATQILEYSNFCDGHKYRIENIKCQHQFILPLSESKNYTMFLSLLRSLRDGAIIQHVVTFQQPVRYYLPSDKTDHHNTGPYRVIC